MFKYRWYLVGGLLFIIGSNVFAIAIAPLVRMAVNQMAESMKGISGSSIPVEVAREVGVTALQFGLLVLGSAIVKGVFMYFMRQTLIVMSRLIEYDLKNEIYEHYQKLGAGFYNRNFTGDLMNRISEDVSRVRMYLGPAIMYTLNLVVLFFMVIGFMLTINAKITFWVLLPLPVLSLSIYYVSDMINRRSDRIQQKLSSITAFVQESFSGIRVLKSYAVEKDFEQSFRDQSDEYKSNYMHLVKVDALFFPLMMMLVGCSIIITIWIGGKEVIAGNFTYGNIAEYIIYVNMLTWPVASLGWVTSLVQRAEASQKRINVFLNEIPEIASGQLEVSELNESIEFRNIHFSYPGKDEVLKGLNFTIHKSEVLALVGATGSGKSTIAALLTRFYDPNAGAITLDGVDIRNLNTKSYRSLFGYVPQDVFLFGDTIENNILYAGLQQQKGPEYYAELADVKDDIEAFSSQFQTVLGERGISLSGGQKQRVSIARAMAAEPEIMVMDDSLSAVDTSTELLIMNNLRSFLKNRTALLISHRLSMAEQADRILVIKEGKIAEEGSHEQLIALKGIYFQMYEQQKTSTEEV